MKKESLANFKTAIENHGNSWIAASLISVNANGELGIISEGSWANISLFVQALAAQVQDGVRFKFETKVKPPPEGH